MRRHTGRIPKPAPAPRPPQHTCEVPSSEGFDLNDRWRCECGRTYLFIIRPDRGDKVVYKGKRKLHYGPDNSLWIGCGRRRFWYSWEWLYSPASIIKLVFRSILVVEVAIIVVIVTLILSGVWQHEPL